VQYIQNEIKKEVGKIKMKTPKDLKPKVYYIVEKNGKEIDIPERSLDGALKQGYKIVKKLCE
jgi:hypothetical protein